MRRTEQDASTAATPSFAQAAQTAQTDRRPHGHGFVEALAVAAVVAVAHLGALDAGFVFDDVARIVRDEQRIAGVWPPGGWMLGTPRPLVELSLAVNHALGGLEPRGYHAFNIVVHALAAAAVVLVVRAGLAALRARGAPAAGGGGLALAAALLWGLHPITTSASVVVVQRAESMAALWTLLAAWALLECSIHAAPRAGSPREGPPRAAAGSLAWGAASVCCTLLAIASKPTAVSMPFILLALDAGIAAGSWRAALARRWPLHAASLATLALLAAFGVVEGVLRDDGGMTGFGLGVAGTTPAGYAALSLRALGLYGALVVWPPLLAIDRGVEAISAWWMPVAGASMLAAMLASLVLGLRRRAWWWTLPACAMLALLPTTSVVPLADAAVDHRMYLPVVAVAVGVAALGARAPRAAATMLLAAALCAETLATVRRVGDFADPVGLWSEVVASSPTHARGYINRSMHLLEERRDDEAAADLLVAERLMPGNPSVQTNLAILEIRRGEPAEALRRLDVVATRTRSDATVLGARGDALRALGAPREAAANYALAAERAPSVALYPLLEGNALAELGDEAGALAAFGRAEARASRDAGLRASALFNMGNLHFRAGRSEEARACYLRALEADPAHDGARRWLRETEDSDGH